MVTVQKVRKELFKFLNSNNYYGYMDVSDYRITDQWLNDSTDEQLEELSKAIGIAFGSTKNPSDMREAEVIRYIISETLNNSVHTVHTHGLLASRSAFCGSGLAVETPLRTALAFYLGLTCDFKGKPLPDGKLLPPEQLESVLRYTYQVSIAAFTQNSPLNLPMNEIYVTVDGKNRNETHTFSMLTLKNKELVKLITSDHGRLDDLINLSIASATTDPVRLNVLLEHEGHTTLCSGAL